MQKINDSITLHYIPMKKLKTSTIGVYIHRPLTADDASKNAIIPRILKRGCALCPSREEIENYLDECYGAELRGGCFKKGEDQVIYFTLESITEKYAPDDEPIFEKMLSLMMSVIFEPIEESGGFSEEFVRQEKKNAIEAIESIKNDKRSYASHRCVEEMCKGTAYAVASYGTTDGINDTDSKSLYEYYKNMIFKSGIDIFVSGECDEEKTAELIKKHLPNNSFTKSNIKIEGILQKSGDVNYIEEKMDVTQGKLSMGFTTGIDRASDDYYCLMVANSIFGGGAHSKLFNNVREKLSLCYYASSSVDRYKTFIVVNAGIEFENYQKAYDEILHQLENVKKGDISELEYVSSINAIVNSLKSCFDDQYAMQSYELSECILKTGIGLEDAIEKIKSVTIDDVVRVWKNVRLDTVYFLKGADAQ